MTPASPEKPCPDPRGWAEAPAPAEAEHSAQCLCQGEGCSLSAGTGHRKRLTIIKPCCQVMVGLGRHPGETEALSTLGGITCLDGAHLERGHALHLGGQGRALGHSHPCPKAGSSLGWEHSTALPLQHSAGASAPQDLPPALAGGAHRVPALTGSTVLGNTDLADKVLVEGPI